MNSFLKIINSKFLLVLMILALVGYAGFKKLSFSTPESSGIEFLKNLKTEEVLNYLSEADAKVYTQHKEDFLSYLPLSLVKIPVETVVFKEIIASSENKRQAFYEVDGRKVQLTLVSEGSWKVYLDLDRSQKINEAQKKLDEAKALGDEDQMLEAYNSLNLIDPQEFYDSQIKALATKIGEKQALKEYVEKVKITKVSIKKGMISAFIQNTGNKNLTFVDAEILITSKSGKVLYKESQRVFEQIPGSKLYGSVIPAGYERKINFDLSSLKNSEDVMVLITPLVVSYE